MLRSSWWFLLCGPFCFLWAVLTVRALWQDEDLARLEWLFPLRGKWLRSILTVLVALLGIGFGGSLVAEGLVLLGRGR